MKRHKSIKATVLAIIYCTGSSLRLHIYFWVM